MTNKEFDVLKGLKELCKSTSLKPIARKIHKDFKTQYKEVFKKLDIDEDYAEYFFDTYDANVKACDKFLKKNEVHHLVLSFMDEVKYKCFPHEKRDDNLIIYHPEVVLMVVLFAKISGCTNFREYSDYWLENNIFLQYLIPGMPEPKYMITDETIRTILTLIPETETEALFVEYFAKVKELVFKAIVNKETATSFIDEETGNITDFIRTLGFDGQKLRASYQKNKFSRKCKQHAVSCVDCDNSTVLASESVHKKNHELSAFFKMLPRIEGVEDNYIIISEALNAREDFFIYCDEQKLNYCMPIKKAFGNKSIFLECEEFFKAENLKKIAPTEIYSKTQSSTAHGRNEKTSFKIVSSKHFSQENLPSDRIKCICCYQKTSQRIIKKASQDEQAKLTSSEDCHYFVVTLDFSKNTLLQVIHSISVRWMYESHHNIIDTVLLQDNQAITKDETASFTIKSNKIVFNVLTYIREKLSAQTGLSRRKNVKLSYKRCIMHMTNPLTVFKYFIEYFMTQNI